MLRLEDQVGGSLKHWAQYLESILNVYSHEHKNIKSWNPKNCFGFDTHIISAINYYSLDTNDCTLSKVLLRLTSVILPFAYSYKIAVICFEKYASYDT